MSLSQYLLVYAFLIVAALMSVVTKKLTVPGGIAGFLVGLLVFVGGRVNGLVMLVAFFALGTLATSWRKADKLHYKSESDRFVKRNAGQVLANGGVAAILGLLEVLTGHGYLFHLMIAAALASATADTLSSELGMVYGRRFFNILTFKKEQKGLDGVISVEGLLIGIIGSAIIAAIAVDFRNPVFWQIIICGTIGNLGDSVLGATFERKGIVGNNAVNFINTLIAALSIFGWVMLT